MPTNRLYLAILALALCMGLAACSKGEDDARDQAVPTVTTARLQPVRWSDELTALGTANARESVTISASVSQTIASVEFDSGQLVKRGQSLVTLTQGQQSAGVAEAQAALSDAQQQYDRNRALADQQLIARVTLDSQRASLEAARARVTAQRATVADRVIRAPFDGVLGLRLVSAGTLVTPGTPITTLDDVSLIKLDFTLPESAMSLLAVGQRVSARSDAWPGEVFEGKVTTIDSRVDPGSRAITVRAEIPNPNNKLRPGMLLEVGVERASRQTIAIPELALQQSGTNASVFRVEAGDKTAPLKVRQVPVQIGARRRGEAEIVSGLKAGDRIVVDGTVKLRDGIAIKDVTASQQAPATAAQPTNGGY